MDQGLILNYEYLAAHITDFLEDDKLCTVFEIEDIRKILQFANLTSDNFISLLKQSSSTIKTRDIFECIRDSYVSINNFPEAIATLKSVKKYVKLNLLDGIINFLIQMYQEMQSLQSIIVEKENIISGLKEDLEIAKYENLNDPNRIYSFLDELSKQGNQRMIEKACKKGLYCYGDKHGKTVLHMACQNSNSRLVISLIKGRCRTCITTYDYYYPIDYASGPEEFEIVKSLIKAGNDKDHKDFSEETPLIRASSNGNIRLVKYLTSIGANIEAKNKYGSNPLLRATENNHFEIIKHLISVGANLEAKSRNGETPLIIASRDGKIDIVKYLISIGANIDARDKEGKTSLICALNDSKLEVSQYLISSGARIDIKDNNGNSTLTQASRAGFLEIVKCLISAGIDKDIKNNDGVTPLMLASQFGHLEIVQYLIFLGSNIDERNKDGNTALILATNPYSYDEKMDIISIEIMKLLISKGANIETKNNKENTPLISAAQNGNLPIVKYLISIGANINATTNNGKTLLYLSRKSVREYLLSIGVKWV